jgi:cytochrome b561
MSGTLLLIVGLIIIEMNKASHPETRFKNIHGIMGLVTFILIILQAVVGFVQFYIPASVLGSVDKGKMLYKYHRVSGYLILLLSLATICAATQTGFNANVLHIQLWAVIVASVLVVAGVLPRVKKQKFGF